MPKRRGTSPILMAASERAEFHIVAAGALVADHSRDLRAALIHGEMPTLRAIFATYRDVRHCKLNVDGNTKQY